MKTVRLFLAAINPNQTETLQLLIPLLCFRALFSSPPPHLHFVCPLRLPSAWTCRSVSLRCHRLPLFVYNLCVCIIYFLHVSSKIREILRGAPPAWPTNLVPLHCEPECLCACVCLCVCTLYYLGSVRAHACRALSTSRCV